jgi:hypothetical protein
MKEGMGSGGGEEPKFKLPSTEDMRFQVAAQDAADFRKMIQDKLSEYTALFNRFKEGDVLTEEETIRMTDLSEELEKLSRGSEKRGE